MNCERCATHLSAYIDDEVSAELREQLRRHLQACEVCRAELEALRCVDAQLRRLRVPAHSMAIAQPDSKHAAPAAPQEPLRPDRLSRQVPRFRARFLPWSITMAVAASVTLAIAFITDQSTIPRKPTPSAVAGRLVRATGSVEILMVREATESHG